jgi:hypothetical protein
MTLSNGMKSTTSCNISQNIVLQKHWHRGFVVLSNRALQRENSGFRFLDTTLVPITAEEEIAEIETAMAQSDQYRPAAVHLTNAMDKLADRTAPYRNSIKESISAVEAMCKIITGDDKATLKQPLRLYES